MRQQRDKRRVGGEEARIAPPPERFRADHVSGALVVRCEEPVADANGGVGRPWKALDTLARMERAGSISRGMRAAGVLFNEYFNDAGLDPLWAADPTRIPVLTMSGKPWSIGRRGSTSALEAVIDALVMLGGISSPGGSCAWHVLGCEMTIERWAISRSWCGHPVHRKVAAGILLTDLGILENYFGLSKDA
jgi:hypothetical protein